jgi:hypothetical protein
MPKRPVLPVEIGPELIHRFAEVLADQAQRMDKYHSEEGIPSRNSEERDQIHHLLADLFASIWMVRKLKGNYAPFCGHEDPRGEYIEARFQKLETRVNFGMFGWKLYLSLDLAKAEYLRNMKDDFWSEVAALQKCGQASFEPYKPMDGSGSPADKALLAKDKSLVFSLIRSCIFLAQSGESCVDFGSLEISWPILGDKENILAGLQEGMGHFYRIAYLLYRAEYQIAHARGSREGACASETE